MALTPAQFRDFHGNDLSDSNLQLLIDDAEAEITERFGDDAEMTVVLSGGTFTLRLYRPLDEGETVTVREFRDIGDDDPETLEDTDYTVIDDGRTLSRHSGRWARFVEITYTPKAEEALRERVAVDLVKLSITYDGMTRSEGIGDYRQDRYAKYLQERESILKGFETRRGFLRFA